MPQPQLDIILCSWLRRHVGTLHKRYEGYAALHFIINGHVDLQLDDQCWQLQGDWVWAGWPGPMIKFAPSGPMPQEHWRCSLSLGPELDCWLEDGLWPTRPLPIRDRASLRATADRCLDALVGQGSWDRRRRINAIEAFLIELQRQQEEPDQMPKWISEVCRQLQQRCCEAIDYKQIARHYQMPLHHFRREFRRYLGRPVHDYVLHERLKLAQQLLVESDASLADIADQCGYRDVYFFSRQFKKLAGIPPSVFRRARYA